MYVAACVTLQDIVDETTIDVETEDDFDEVFGSVSF
jgi:hypothetical protein